ncbi:MAG TPA: 1,4-alpha-glucan branching protein GlgB [Candidatus Paceibacterota bacterium]|nr:1,4-alpha-glucan branching protein GlgB [Candidatus Paceibacterota bacterium]
MIAQINETKSAGLSAVETSDRRRVLTSDASPAPPESPRLSEADMQLFLQGRELRAYDKLGAHLKTVNGVSGTEFAVWAPNAERVQVMGDFNGWNKGAHELHPLGQSGIWTGFAPGVGQGVHYKFHIASRYHCHTADKADPFAFHAELPPRTASVVHELHYDWSDQAWMNERRGRNSSDAPISIYEVHLGSWRRVPEENNRWLTYREIAPRLAEYAREMGFTHVELMPITEHPFYGSWGYQTTGFFAPTSRYGTPQDFMYFVDCLHQHGIGVILDWVPSHFPTDGHGLVYFDGTHLFEHADPRKGFHPDWKSSIFNHGRNEVRSFLMSSALFWLDKYHIDGLRLDAVASMLYLDYSRKQGGWIPNHRGGRENLEAIHFLQQLNIEVYGHYPDVISIAEESTAWSNVSRPVHHGGLGFGMKWDMGWMHDTLRYMKIDPIHRKHHHNELSFRMVYAFTENFVLSLSHDEVVHGKGSLFGRMTGDDWQKYANLRLLFGYMFAQPGKKLLFMGGELAQWPEWSHESSIEWHALNSPEHAGVQKWVSDLNHLYQSQPALHESDFHPEGFEWIDHTDARNSTLSFIRKARSNGAIVLAVLNFTPVPRQNYRIGVPRGGYWKELLNSDAQVYGGSGQGNGGGVQADGIRSHGRPCSVNLTLPPLGALFFVNT